MHKSWDYANYMGMAEDLLTTKAAAKVLGVHHETLRRWADEKRIRHILLPSGQLRFRPEDLREVLVPVEPAPKAG